MRRLFLTLIAVVVTGLALSSSSSAATSDQTPLTCDTHDAKWHIARARAVIRFGYSKGRLPDPTPMKGHEKRALRSHKFCIRDEARRARIARFRDHVAGVYHAKLEAYEPEWPSPESVGVSSATLASIRECESGGDYTINTGSGYYGAYQFNLAAWQSVGGSGLPSDASPAEQDYRAALLYARSGPAPWPVCGYR